MSENKSTSDRYALPEMNVTSIKSDAMALTNMHDKPQQFVMRFYKSSHEYTLYEVIHRTIRKYLENMQQSNNECTSDAITAILECDHGISILLRMCNTPVHTTNEYGDVIRSYDDKIDYSLSETSVRGKLVSDSLSVDYEGKISWHCPYSSLEAWYTIKLTKEVKTFFVDHLIEKMTSDVLMNAALKCKYILL